MEYKQLTVQVCLGEFCRSSAVQLSRFSVVFQACAGHDRRYPSSYVILRR